MIDAMTEVARFMFLSSIALLLPIYVSDVLARNRARERHSRYRERERRHELAQRENEYQRKMACKIWQLEDFKVKQTVKMKGCTASPEAAGFLQAVRAKKKGLPI